MAVIEVCDQKLICIDYDRPVWHAKDNFEIRATPNLNHFVVDGILAALSIESLKQFGITQRFNSADFEKNLPSYELKRAREILYQADDLKIKYFHEHDGDIQIHQDLARFKMPIGTVNRVNSEELLNLTK
jgi:hypothetical protein